MRRNLTIRHKILLGFLVPVICLAVLAMYAHSNLRMIDQRIRVLGQIERMELSIMELRRQGKWFLFYGTPADYEAVLAATSEAIELLSGVEHELVLDESRQMAGDLGGKLARYRETIGKVRGIGAANDEAALRLKSDAHELSMELEDQVKSLSRAVRGHIADISASVRRQILAAALGMALFFGLVVSFIISHVLRPLKTIERTTKSIARGDFTPVEVQGPRDEMRDVQQAFNSMVDELKKRQEQLVQSQKLSSIGVLTAGIAHQVNNPLNNISLAAQYLADKRKGAADQGEAKALLNIQKETDRARDIVQSLLNFARRTDFCLSRVKLAIVVENAVRFASADLPPGVRIERDIPDDIELELDPRRMSEALLNIIINGVQAVGAGPGLVRIDLCQAPAPGMLTLAVRDTGGGIAPEDIAHVFDPFFTRKQVGRGTGLGLSVAYGIVEDCKGSIRVESEPGKGTVFYLDLPLPE